MNKAPARPARRKPVSEFFIHLVEMPAWHRKLLIGAGLLASVGLLGQSSKLISRSPAKDAEVAEVTSMQSDGKAPTGRSFVSRSGKTSDIERVETPPPPKPTMFERISPWASRVGFGFVGGFIIGWAFRAFIKTMAIVTTVGVSILWGLSHFNVINLDLAAAETKFKTSTSWVSEQAAHLKERAMTLVPGSFSSIFGVFIGFRRK